jgi:aminobenzoyl-glutamate utilization protein B
MRPLVLFLAIALPLGAQLPKPSANTAPMLSSLDAAAAHYATVAKQIWTYAEVGYMEEKSSALLQSELKNAGFTVKAGVAGEPTAFVAEFGSGKPVIAILGEFDALPGLSQDTVPERKVPCAVAPGTAAAITCSVPRAPRPRSRSSSGCRRIT